MAGLIEISRPENLPSIVDIIHDCRFDKDEIVFDSDTSVLEIKFFRETWEKRKIINNFFIVKKVQVPITLWILKISHVERYQIREGNQEGPGSEDYFNDMDYNGQNKELLLSTIVGEGILIKVKELEVSVEETEMIIGKKTSFAVFA